VDTEGITKGNDFFDSIDENSKLGKFNPNTHENLSEKPDILSPYTPYDQNFSKKRGPDVENRKFNIQDYEYKPTYKAETQISDITVTPERNPYSIIEDYDISNMENQSKKDPSMLADMNILNVDQIVANLPSDNITESNEVVSLGIENEEKSQVNADLRVVKPTSIKDQIMLNLNNDSIIVGEEIILEDVKEIPLEEKKVTKKIMETFNEDFYKPYENDAQDNMNYLLNQKLEEKEDVEVIKKNYGKTKRIGREDLDEFIRNGLRGTDTEIRNRIEYQKQSVHKKAIPKIKYQKPETTQETVISYPKESLPFDSQKKLESRIQEAMLTNNDSEILKGMRHTVQEEPRIYYKSSGYATLQPQTRNQFDNQPKPPLTINNASIGPDIVRFTHENGQTPIIVQGEKYYKIEELQDYDENRVYQKEPVYESDLDRQYTEYRETIKSKSSRGTYNGFGDMLMGRKSGVRLNYQSHLDDLRGSSKYSKYY
jgi:hypothetical protein